MMEAGVPGMRSRVAVIKPPLTEPTYIATRNARALCGSMLNVSGNESEMSIAPVSPGMAPTVIPSAVPSKTRSTRFGSERTSKIIGVLGEIDHKDLGEDEKASTGEGDAKDRHGSD